MPRTYPNRKSMLSRRLEGHADFLTVYRYSTHESLEQAAQSRITGESVDANIIQATWAGTADQIEPEESMIPTKEPVLERSQVSQSQAAAPHPAPKPPARVSVPSTTIPAIQAKPAPTTLDQDWKRLQTIFNKHKEQEQIEAPEPPASTFTQAPQELSLMESLGIPASNRYQSMQEMKQATMGANGQEEATNTTTPAAESPTPQSLYTLPQTVQSVSSRKVDEIIPPPSRPSVARPDVPPQPSPTTIHEGMGGKPAGQPESRSKLASLDEPFVHPIESDESQPVTFQNHVEESQSGTPLEKPTGQDISYQPDTVKPRVQRQDITPASKADVKHQPAVEIPATEQPTQKIVIEPPRSTIPTTDRVIGNDETPEERSYQPFVELQPLPLEAAWQVKRKPQEPVDAQPSQPSQPMPTTGQYLAPEDGERIHTILEGTIPGKDTDSSIEMITPRNPRPIPTSVQQVALEEIHPPTVQREPTLEAPRIIPQSKPVTPSRLPTAVDTSMIQTEIGELPADLWTLIGESPPNSVQQKPVSIETIPSPTTVQMKKEEVPKTPLDLISRVETTTQPSSGNQAGTPSAPQTGAPNGGEVDVDELARRVYSEIKRRLSVEWERLRHRR